MIAATSKRGETSHVKLGQGMPRQRSPSPRHQTLVCQGTPACPFKCAAGSLEQRLGHPAVASRTGSAGGRVAARGCGQVTVCLSCSAAWRASLGTRSAAALLSETMHAMWDCRGARPGHRCARRGRSTWRHDPSLVALCHAMLACMDSEVHII